jgi:heat shock protein HslJ
MTVRFLGPLAGLALIAACAAPAPAPRPAPAPAPAAPAPAPVAAPDPAVLGAWVIEQARSAPLTDKSKARLVFGPDGAMSGHASCNTMRGRYTLEGNALKIGAIATTRMICSEAQLEQEDRVLTALERARRAAVPPHGFLTLWDADGAVLMRASRAPELHPREAR